MNFDIIPKYTNRFDLMFYCLEQSTDKGLNLEFGVLEGTTINMCSEKHPERHFYGFDSFEGLPEDWRSGFLKGQFSLNGNLPTVNTNVTLIKGLFSDTLKEFLLQTSGNVSFLHIDCDLYSSTKTVLWELKDRICSGTIILFDEFYNYPGWENGEYKAWNEFAESNKINFEYIGYNACHEQVALKVI